MCNRYNQMNMSYSLASYLFLRYFNTTPITDNSSISNSLIFPTMTFPVFYRSKYPFTKKTILLWLIGSIVDCLWLKNLTS